MADRKTDADITAPGKISKKDDTHPTTYLEAITHIFKGNVGPGLFAMGDAFKNGGIIAAPILTVIIAMICVHCEHILVTCSKRMLEFDQGDHLPDYAETVEQCFIYGHTKLKRISSTMKTVVNIFICTTQLGFCCIYFVFISENFKQIFEFYGIHLNSHIVMIFIFIPILIPSLITKLKFLAPVSQLANFCMITGLLATLYFAFKDGFPPINERNYYTSGYKLGLYFGTAMFAFEGIALVLPIRLSMEDKTKFESTFGVLNVGMCLVSFAFIMAGFFGYWQWGEDVGASLTLNVDVSHWLGQYVKIAVSLGVLFGYPIQFFIAIQIMWPAIRQIFHCRRNSKTGETVFRFSMVLLTFGIAELVPKLNLLISLLGALCSTTLALVFPPLIELICKSTDNSSRPGPLIFIKNIIILIIAAIGFSIGTYESMVEMIDTFQK